MQDVEITDCRAQYLTGVFGGYDLVAKQKQRLVQEVVDFDIGQRVFGHWKDD